MWALFTKTIKDRKWNIIIYTLVAILTVWMYIGMFPSFSSKADEFKQLMNAYPESMMKAFGVEDSALIFSSIEHFLAMENFSMLWPIMLIALLVAWGGSAIAGEVEKGTIETLLSQPLSRAKIFFSKYFSGVTALIVFTFLSIFSVIPLAKLYDVDLQINSYYYISALGFMFGLAIYSISMFFSAVFSEKGRAYFLGAGIMVIMYFLQIISSLKESLADLKYATFFYYFDFNKALFDHQISNLSIEVFLGVSILFTALAVLIFSKRDITV